MDIQTEAVPATGPRRCRLIVALSAYAIALLGAHQSEVAVAAAREPRPVVVFAAASLKSALDAAGKAWTDQSGRSVTFSYAASGALVKQIENGAPADLFASADLRWMAYASENGLIKPESRTALLGNALVLIAPRDAVVPLEIANGFKLAEAIGDGRIATGVPGMVPAGTYAKEALTSLGVWDEVSGKIAGSESVRAALSFVARGEAMFGIVYATDAKSEPKVAVVGTFPADSHQPIVYPFAITAASTNPSAREFLAFLRSSTARGIFEADGFSVLPD